MRRALSAVLTEPQSVVGEHACGRALVLAAVLAVLGIAQARAEMRSGPVSEDGGPLSELSTNTRNGSRSVHERARTLSDDRTTRLSGAPVRGSITGPLRSGPVSDVSAGSVRGAGGTLRERTVEEGSLGTVKKDTDAPLHEFSAEPLNDFGLLQHELRGVRPLAPNSDASADGSGDPMAHAADLPSDAAPLPEANEDPDSDAAEPADAP
jgi:hypothetical protein